MDKKQAVELVKGQFDINLLEDSTLIFESKESLFKFIYLEENEKEELLNLMIGWGELKKEMLEDGETVLENILKQNKDVFYVNNTWIYCPDWEDASLDD